MSAPPLSSAHNVTPLLPCNNTRKERIALRHESATANNVIRNHIMKKTETASMTGSELIRKLSKDWLERDGESFVRIRTRGRLGWEESLKEGTPYSSYLLESPSMEELIRRAYALASNTISAMDIPSKVTVRLGGGGSCTEGRNVYVATDYFDDGTLSTGEKLDIFLGLTAHEGSHLLYTEFPLMKKAAGVHPLCANLLNIIEDERIERNLGEDKPGLANYLKAVKRHYFGRYAGRTEGPGEATTLQKILNCILGLIRYPRLLREEEMVEYGTLLLKVEKILTPYPDTTASAERAAEKIFRLIVDEYGRESGTEDAGKGEPSPEKSGRESPSADSGEDSTDGGDDNASGDCGDQERDSGNEDEDTTGEGRPGGRSMEECLEAMESDLKKIADALDEVAGSPLQPDVEGCSSLSGDRMSDAVSADRELLAKICEGEVETGSSKDIIFTRQKEYREGYMSALEEVKQYVPAVRRVVKGRCLEYSLTHLGMRSGVLDTGKLAEAVQGVPTVYKRQGEVHSDRACVCILVDESGSMCRHGRMQAARKTAVLLNEALSSIPNIELFIYGHTADCERSGNTELNIYREKGYAPKYALGSLEPRSNNRDGMAILETALRVRKQTREEVLMFIISDGEPAAEDYFGMKAIGHTKECVEKAEAMGFRIVQICINANYDPALMFRHFIKMENLGTLARDLGREIAKALSSKIKTHVI